MDDPFALLTMPIETWPPDSDPVMDAARGFDPVNPAPLVNLLASKDAALNLNGLLVFGELGRKGLGVLDMALNLTSHPDKVARAALMDGIISYPEALSARQAAAVLTLVGDPADLVREKVVIFLAYSNLDVLKAAIAALDEASREKHLAGFGVFAVQPPDAQKLFDKAVAGPSVWRDYAFAAVVRMARNKQVQIPIAYDGDRYVENSIKMHIKMLLARQRGGRSRPEDFA
jgi:hypothetical protein